MFNPLLTPRDIAERYHRFMPDEIRQYIKGRGVPATFIDRQLLGWNGERVTIPIFGRSLNEVRGFRYAKVPDDAFATPEISSDPDAKPDIYGWETLAREPHRIVICDDEFDRLVLEARGFPAVALTGGPGTFAPEWAAHFQPIPHVFICFRRTAESEALARDVQRMLPKARLVRLPAEAGDGTITDFFVGLQRTQLDFEVLLASAIAAVDDLADRPPTIREFRPVHRSLQRRAERIRTRVPLHEIVSECTRLQAAGGRLVGHCPFHDDSSASFAVYPARNTYSCSGCGAEGDVILFLMNKESMTLGQALNALERFEITHELHGLS